MVVRFCICRSDGQGNVEKLEEVETMKQDINRLNKLIIYYEMKEATTLSELAFWKATIDTDDVIVNPTSRCPCHRIEVPGPVKDTILHYLYLQEQIFDWRQDDSSTA